MLNPDTIKTKDDLKLLRLLVCDSAYRTLIHTLGIETRPLLAIENARKYITGEATLYELDNYSATAAVANSNAAAAAAATKAATATDKETVIEAANAAAETAARAAGKALAAASTQYFPYVIAYQAEYDKEMEVQKKLFEDFI